MDNSIYTDGVFVRLWRALMRQGLRHLARNLLLDLRFGGRPLGGGIRDPGQRAEFLPTMNSDYDSLAAYFSGFPFRSDDVFVDVGCGKGRTFNYLLGRGLRMPMIGYEVNPSVAAFTARRLRAYVNVKIITADATALDYVPGTVFYLYNPFTRPFMERFVSALERSAVGKPRLCVIYHNAFDLEVFHRSGRWRAESVPVNLAIAASGGVILHYEPGLMHGVTGSKHAKLDPESWSD